jgi:hypothetical protein
VVLLGLLLILLAAGAAVWLVLGSQSLTTPITLSTPGAHIGMTPLALLITGAVILLMFWLGLLLIRGSVKRRRRPGREAKEVQRQAELEENIRADERARAEETHQNALSERDRIRDEEFQSQLAERERVRDSEERTRMSEAETRIRADERAKVEDEFRQREPAYTGSHAADGTVDPGSAQGDEGSQRGDEASATTDSTDASGPTEAPEQSGRDQPYRTVADKLMGRGPTGEA